ncbi:MAG: hypothetical protein IKV80_08565 [Bacteroidales bacterium]|nr:hypothetical protein [Bacteroidales bacterium]
MMKKFTAIMMALMMVLTLTQCKPDKGNEGDTPNGSKVKVSCVIPMNKNTRSEFDNLMTDGSIKWSAGTERIYLAIPNETNPQIVELTAFTTVESNILLFEGEVEAGLLTAGEYEVWYLGNSKESGNSYITEEIEDEVIKSISGSIANQSGDLDDLGYHHIAMTTVTAETEGEEVVLSLNGTLKNKIAIAHLDLEGITNLKGNAIVGTEYALQYNNGAFEFAVTEDASANINVTEGTTASYVVLFPNSTANVDLKSNTSKMVTFEGGVEANKIYYKHVSDMEYYPLAWEDYEEETNTINGHEYVDLGLPSGLLWATCNVGANAPEAYGNYYAWGETETKSEYTEENSVTYGRQMNDISGNAQFDAATANWGDGWRMPTTDEQFELMCYCDVELTSINGVDGWKLTSNKNGNYIFLPLTGFISEELLTREGWMGHFWSSTPTNSELARQLDINDIGEFSFARYGRCYGLTIRPVSGGNFTGLSAQYAFVETSEVKEITSSSAVCGGNVTTDNGSTVTAKGVCWSTNQNPTVEDNKTTDGSSVGNFTSNLSNLEPNTIYYVRAYATNAAGTSYGETISFTTLAQTNTINGHEYVDLGLSVKWATCNVGANSPEEYGDYFAWGEVETNDEYIDANCQTYDKEMGLIGGTEYDAATVNWKGGWRMPKYGELEELINRCTWEWTTQNGIYGNKVIGPNGNSIFLPAAGMMQNSSNYYKDSTGYYWCDSPKADDYFACRIWFSSSKKGLGSDRRYIGQSIRPVID